MRGSFSKHSALLCLVCCAACSAPTTGSGGIGGGAAGTFAGVGGQSGGVGGYSGGVAGVGAFGGTGGIGGAGGFPPVNYAGTSGGADAGTRPPDSNECGGMSYDADPLPVDIFIVMDASGSMFVPVVGAWYTVVGAVKTFVSSPSMAGVGTALNLYNNECSVMINAQPMVPMAELPGNAAPISQTLDAYLAPLSDLTGYNTNTEPALRGAVQHQIAWQASHPDRKSVILLVTDGFPTNECGSLDVEGAAAQAFAAGIKTFVLGLGNTFGLDAVAAAGGTGAAVVADVSGQGVLAKLDEIRGRAFASCTLNFNDNNVPPDVSQVSLFVTNTGDGIKYEVPRDRMGGGWTLSSDGRTAELNGTLCDEALSGRLQNLTFANGCPSGEPPPPPLPPIIPD